MELKTDKIHRILNTPYDELSPQDFAVAQEQLDVLVVGARDKQIDAFQFIENKLVCERDAARAERDQLAQTATANAETLRMTEREHAVTVENLETALTGTKAERDQFKGICERLKRELEEAKSDILGAKMATQREYDGQIIQLRDDLHKARYRITDLKHIAKTDAEAIANLTKERDQLDDELTELRQAPSGTAKQAERIRELKDKLDAVVKDRDAARAEVGAQQIEHVKWQKTTDRLTYDIETARVRIRELEAEIEQAKAQAANASAMVVSIATERDAAQQRELKALRQLADLVERTSKPTFYEYPAPRTSEANCHWFDVVFDGPPGHESGRFVEVEDENGKSINIGRWIDRGDGMWALRIGETAAGAFAKLAAEETADAHEAQDKREAELDKHGYGLAPGMPPMVVGMADFVPSAVERQPAAKLEPAPMLCSMPTPDGQCTAPATGRNNGWPFCSRHLDAIRDGRRREHEQAAMARVDAAIAAGKADPLATSIDDGQSWWCPKCQASIVPNVPHVCPGMTCRRCGSSVLDGKDHGVGACPGDGMP